MAAVARACPDAEVVVFPGGGYQILTIDLEGTEICDWLTSNGITCVLLKYRVPHSGPSWQRDCNCRINPKPQPALQDAQRTVGLVRMRAAEWHIDPHRIGVYYVALKDTGVPTELHLYVNGGHAFGLRRTNDPITEWPRLVERWLSTIGTIAR
jgi:hypothetical protein